MGVFASADQAVHLVPFFDSVQFTIGKIVALTKQLILLLLGVCCSPCKQHQSVGDCLQEVEQVRTLLFVVFKVACHVIC